jgi:hypothetical protein
MIDTFLIPQNTTLTAKGDGDAIDINAASSRTFLVTLTIADIVEPESLEITVFGSTDGATWDPKPVLAFPQKFYRGESPMLLELESRPEIKFVRAHWEVNRWGRGPEQPLFVCQLVMKEVPADILTEARGRR